MGGVGQSVAVPVDAALAVGPSGLKRLTASIAREIEAEQDRWFLWVAVGFGSGIAGYFGAYTEPPAWTLALVVVSTLLIHLFVRRVGLWGLASGFMLAMALGAITGKLRTEYMRAPVLARPLSSVTVKGWVELGRGLN